MTRLACPLGWKSARVEFAGLMGDPVGAGTNYTLLLDERKNGETCCEGYQPLCGEVQVTA